MSDKIKYVKHPVSPEEKSRLLADGFTIIDERFKPKENPVQKKISGQDAKMTSNERKEA